MKKKISIFVLSVVFAAGSAYGSGYRIPEQSINSTALSNAYIANTTGADSAYFNPANMSWQKAGWLTDAELMYIHLPKVTYGGTSVGAAANGDSKAEDFVMPVLHAVSPDVHGVRFGLSVVYPVGLSKRWDEAAQRRSAEDFTLKTVEFNPSVSYKINDRLSIGGGVRVTYASGEVRSDGVVAVTTVPIVVMHSARRDLEGDTTEYGYNLAATYKPLENWTLAATYRSKISLEVEGDAKLYYQNSVAPGYVQYYNGYASVNIPVPAVLTLATSYSYKKTTFEFAYDKTYWSEYERLDFNYSAPLASIIGGTPGVVLSGAFDAAKNKQWSNADAFRFGITHQCTDDLTVMLGFALDKNPVPDATLGYELPDSDAKLYSLGIKYALSDTLHIGASYLFDDKEDRTVNQGATGIQGTFTDGGAHLFNIGLNYTF